MIDWVLRVIESISDRLFGPVIDDAHKRRREIESNCIRFGMSIAIETENRKIVGADLNKEGILVASVRHIKTWEIFRIVDPSNPFVERDGAYIRYGDQVALRACNDHFVTTNLDSGDQLIAIAAQVQDWEVFTILLPPGKKTSNDRQILEYGSFFALQGCNGKYVCHWRQTDQRLRASADRIQAWEHLVFRKPTDFK